jgi:GAF domain-containing protein
MDNEQDELENKSHTFNLIINNVFRIAKSATNRTDKLKKICTLLKNDILYYDWVGFYIANTEQTELILGPFAGAPTEHTKIPFGSGICGQAAERKETFIVPDVSKETNYLSCSPKVKSEIVIPIMKNDNIIGELDIDSHSISPFTSEDEDFLNNVCNIISQLF